MNIKYESIARLEHALIVSTQASDNEPLNTPEHLCALALSGLNGGARALRLEGCNNIAYIRSHCDVPIIGLVKSEAVAEEKRLESVYITASFADAKSCAEAGADIIACDATQRARPDGLSLAQLIERIHSELDRAVWADVATCEEGIAAAQSGADLVSTTLYGYTSETKRDAEEPPDFQLLSRLCRELDKPVVLEGRVWHPQEVQKAFELGAYAVVVGSAITRPQLITRRFVAAVPKKRAESQ